MNVTDAFGSVQALLRKKSSETARRFGLDAEDLFAQASYRLVEGFAGYDESRPLSTWAGTRCVKRALADLYYRTDRYKAGRYGKSSTEMPEEVPQKEEFDLNEFLDSLSEDAVAVVDLLLEPPPAFLLRLERLTPTAVRHSLRDWLGWEVSRVKTTFAEIREALKP